MSENPEQYGQPRARSEDILLKARETIAARLPRDVRYQFINGKHDGFQVVQAICDAIEAERERCAKIAEGAGLWPDPEAVAAAIRLTTLPTVREE